MQARASYISAMFQKIGGRLAEKKYVRGLLEHPADLAEFRERPTPRLIAGLILMGLSYLIGWPAVAALSILAVWLNEPLIAVIGGPATYGFSHVVFFLGAWLARAPHYLGLLTRYAIGVLLRSLGVSAQELKVYAAGAVKEVVIRVAPEFTKSTGITVVPIYDTVGALRDRLLAGERADAAMLSDAAIDALADKGLIAPGSRRSLGSVAIALAIKKGASIPDIATPEGLKETLLGAKSISYADPNHGATAGAYFAMVLDQLGIRDRITDRLTLLPFGVEVIQAVADGRVELGVSQSSEISLHPGVSLVGRLPEPHALVTPYAAAIMEGASENATRFLDFLTTKAGADALAEAGFSEEGPPQKTPQESP
jgi:molybdate transport system substrate-binding protein